MTNYQSQEEHDHFECGEETAIGERSMSMEERDEQIRAEERQRVIEEVNELVNEKLKDGNFEEVDVLNELLSQLEKMKGRK